VEDWSSGWNGVKRNVSGCSRLGTDMRSSAGAHIP